MDFIKYTRGKVDVFGIVLSESLRMTYVCLELPYAPSITSVALSSSVANAVDVEWTPSYDGNTPVLRFTIDFRRIVVGELLLLASFGCAVFSPAIVSL